jgi:hypothetical protein
MNRSEFVESEFSKWKKIYAIPFHDEFKVRMVHNLRYTYDQIPHEHVKSKKDCINAINDLLHDIKLMPISEENEKVDIKDVLRKLNRPFISRLWKLSKSYGDYLKHINLKPYRDYTWKDSEF